MGGSPTARSDSSPRTSLRTPSGGTWKGLAWFALLAVPGVFLLAWMTDRLGGLGPRLVPLGLAFTVGWILLTQPLANAVSRRYEAEADWLALQATHDPASGVALEQSFVKTSLADSDPPGWVTFWYGTHPTPMQRIAMARSRFPARGGSDSLLRRPLRPGVVHRVHQLSKEARRHVHAADDDAGDVPLLDLVVDAGERERELVVREADVAKFA